MKCYHVIMLLLDIDKLKADYRTFRSAFTVFIRRPFYHENSVYPCKICNGNRTEWSPIQSVIIRVITKSDDRAAEVRFVYYEYDYRLNWTTRSPIIN